jgi:hypothetical protein
MPSRHNEDAFEEVCRILNLTPDQAEELQRLVEDEKEKSGGRGNLSFNEILELARQWFNL